MASIVEMREERAKLFEKIKELVERSEKENREFNHEEQTAFDKLNDEIDKLKVSISAAEKAQRVEMLRQQVETQAPPWAAEKKDEDEGQRLVDFIQGRLGTSFEVRANAAQLSDLKAGTEKRDLLAGSGTGVNVIPISFLRRLREYEIENSGVRQAGPTVLRTSSGEALRVPRATAHPTATLITEGSAITESDPTLSFVTLDAYKYANMQQLSREFLQDEAVNVLEYLARQNGTALGNGSGAHFITGTGSGQPNGIVTAATAVAFATGQSTSVTGDSLIDMVHRIPTGQRGRSAWLMRDASVASVRKIKETGGQYIWQPGLQAGVPDRLLGYPVFTDPNVAAMAANAKSVIFGDFSSYYIRDVGSVVFERSDHFAFNVDLVSFRAIARTDGDLVDANGLTVGQNSAT